MTTCRWMLLLLAAACVSHAHNICKPRTVPCAVQVMPLCGLTRPALEYYQMSEELTTMLPSPTASVTTTPPGPTTKVTTTPGPTTRVSRAPRPTEYCDRDAFLMQEQKFYKVNLRKVDMTPITDMDVDASWGDDLPEGSEVNALGFNTLDNFLYGTRNRTILRFLHKGETEAVAELGFKPNMGTFDSNGSYWLGQGGTQWARFDLKPGSATYGTTIGSGKSTLGRVPPPADWASTPRYPGYLFGVGVNTGRKRNPVLVAWSIPENVWIRFYESPDFLEFKSVAFGAVVSTRDGVIYAVENKRGAVYRFPLVNTALSSKMGHLPGTTRTDAARCVDQPDWDP